MTSCPYDLGLIHGCFFIMFPLSCYPPCFHYTLRMAKRQVTIVQNHTISSPQATRCQNRANLIMKARYEYYALPTPTMLVPNSRYDPTRPFSSTTPCITGHTPFLHDTCPLTNSLHAHAGEVRPPHTILHGSAFGQELLASRLPRELLLPGEQALPGLVGDAKGLKADENTPAPLLVIQEQGGIHGLGTKTLSARVHPTGLLQDGGRGCRGGKTGVIPRVSGVLQELRLSLLVPCHGPLGVRVEQALKVLVG